MEETHPFGKIGAIKISNAQAPWKLMSFDKSHYDIMQVAKGGFAQVLVRHLGFRNKRLHDCSGLENEGFNV